MIYMKEGNFSDEELALWEQTKTHELCKDIKGIIESPFHIKIPAVSPYSKSTFLVADWNASTSEEIDKSVLEKLRELDNLPYRSSEASGLIPATFNDAMRDGSYEGPYLADFMNMADAWEKGLKDTVDLLHELKVAGNLDWDTFSEALADRDMKSFVRWMPVDDEELREKIGNSYPYSFWLYADQHMGNFFGKGTDVWITKILPEQHTDTPDALLDKLQDAYMTYDRDEIIARLADSIFDIGFDNDNFHIDAPGWTIPNFEMVFRGATLQCQKAADMADKLENALELNRDRSKEQTIAFPEKSTPPWNPDVTKMAKEQSRSKSNNKSKDEIER